MSRDFWPAFFGKTISNSLNVCGVCFPASNLPREAVSASMQHIFANRSVYVDGRCRKCRQFRNTTRPGQVFGGPPTS